MLEGLGAAHAAGIRVVGWYLPSFTNNRRDLSRILAGAAFRSPNGWSFDSFALDVESTKVRSIALRTRRALRLVAAVRQALPKPYVLGAITIDPVGARYWPRYPFRQLARQVDVFLPMPYFTARTSGPRKVGAYSRANVERVRSLAGDASLAMGKGNSAEPSLGRVLVVLSDGVGLGGRDARWKGALSRGG